MIDDVVVPLARQLRKRPSVYPGLDPVELARRAKLLSDEILECISETVGARSTCALSPTSERKKGPITQFGGFFSMVVIDSVCAGGVRIDFRHMSNSEISSILSHTI
jgi:hypothetical protein